MLMQNFKAADDLGITEPQKDALIKTLVLLETNQLIYVERQRLQPGKQSDPFTGGFNMSYWHSLHDCGTAGCIGGTAEKVGSVQFMYLPDRLEDLFYPQEICD